MFFRESGFYRRWVRYGMVFLFVLLAFGNLFAQEKECRLIGRILDAKNFQPIYSVNIISIPGNKKVVSSPDGSYELTLPAGKRKIIFRITGYREEIVEGVVLVEGGLSHLDIYLDPIISVYTDKDEQQVAEDSSVQSTAISKSGLKSARRNWNILQVASLSGLKDIVYRYDEKSQQTVDVTEWLGYLRGLLILDNAGTLNNPAVQMAGMAPRYGQLLLNGVYAPDLNGSFPAVPLYMIQSEAVQSISFSKLQDVALPSNAAAGSVNIATNDYPSGNYYYLRISGGIFSANNSQDFLGDRHTTRNKLGLSGGYRSLPPGFPSTKSEYTFNQKNPQEQVAISRLLTNNLAARNYGSAFPSDRILLGYGRRFNFKKGVKLGIQAQVHHSASSLVYESMQQAAPNTLANPYPFARPDLPAIWSQGNSKNYQYNSQTNISVGTSMIFGKNKISLKAYYGNQYSSSYVEKVDMIKPDEDTLAHHGISIKTGWRKMFNVLLSGEHALGKAGKFRLNWIASNTSSLVGYPDEINLLLKQKLGNDLLYELAQQSSSSQFTVDSRFTNNSRLWREYRENDFTGLVNIGVPFRFGTQMQYLSGGLFIHSRFREFWSDLFLVQGSGYGEIGNLLSEENYYPGGLSILNYYQKVTNFNQFFYNAGNRGNNYSSSQNQGAAFLKLNGRISNSFWVNGGIRIESNAQLVSSIQYNYYFGFKNSRKVPLDENSYVSEFGIYPALQLKYFFHKNIQLVADYSRSSNRPRPEELSYFRYYDASRFLVNTGNALLEKSIINNLSATLTLSDPSGCLVALTGFYRFINHPIETVISNYSISIGNYQAIPYNMPHAEVKSLNASLQVNLGMLESKPWLSWINLFADAIFTDSKVDAGPLKSNQVPEMGQHDLTNTPGFTLNTGMVFRIPSSTVLSVVFNRTSDYLMALGSGKVLNLSNGNQIRLIPDYYVRRRNQLNVRLSQKLFHERVQVIAGITNLLQEGYTEFQDLNGNKKFDERLKLSMSGTGNGALYLGGTDNAVYSIPGTRSYFLSFSFLFQ